MSKDYFAIDTNKMPWDILEVEDIGAHLPAKLCVADEDTGMSVQKVVYKAGFTNIDHWHNCAHGIYVLDGTLRTHAGEYGPGSFVWFPAHTMMSHGATEDNDVTFLFITNRPFDIHYHHVVGGPPEAASHT